MFVYIQNPILNDVLAEIKLNETFLYYNLGIIYVI